MSSPADRRRVAAVAGHAGDTTTARRLLDDAHPTVRATALTALARAGDLTPQDLAGAFGDADPTVRRRGAALAAVHPGGSLRALLEDPDPSVVETAAWACGERHPLEAGTVDALASLATDHDDALVREACVAALGAIGDPAGLPAVLRACADRATVRRRAVLALAPFEGRDVDAALRRALDDRDWQVRQAAEDLLDGPAPS